MKKIFIVFLITAFIIFLLPLAIVYIMGIDTKEETKEEKGDAGIVSVYIADEDRVEEMEIGKYLKCVVAAEMPAEFEEEALKAQAVAARTYLFSKLEQEKDGNIPEAHKGADICTDHTHCQAYISEEKRREAWGDVDADLYWDKISRSVDETAGQVMTYNGEIISALFHSTSSGTTEAAVDVWGSDIPYLQSVKSEGDPESPKYLSSLTVTEEEFKRKIDENISGTDWSGELFSDIKRSDAGGIISLKTGGVTIKGTELRSIFSLRSANVELTQENGSVQMDVKGYGHGVGMSQYGANYMASEGSSYENILKTYYTGIEIEQM